jgi:lantibiotic modifying enzyme
LEIASSPVFSSDCLCHGNLGNILIVGELNAGATLAVSRLAETAFIRFSRRGVVCGNFGIESPGLMEDLAGVGLGQLKLAKPELIPNVLVLE